MVDENDTPGDFTVVCPICHGTMADARLRAPGFDNEVYVELCPATGPHQTFLIRAFVCNNCGYIQLVAVLDQEI